ncbi:MAG: S26 family signal peptidase [Planctomycetota bacterium]|jgi:signal peptidase I
MSEPGSSPSDGQDGSAVETLQSLIVAFVLAMTFRGFVTEGFVIPTGSMAPTLMGQHLLLHSDQTGVDYPVDSKGSRNPRPVHDPMLGRHYRLSTTDVASLRPRMGDRILVLKCLYPFSEPRRFDVVVFKNPTDPDGDAENYIKRLVGLPNEAIWLVNGDVFVGSADDPEDLETYEIKRKPEHVQRAVWQPVHDSDYIPIDPPELEKQSGRRYTAPWRGENWQTEDRRSYRFDSAEPTTLEWNPDQIPLDDRTPYNMVSYRPPRAHAVSDLRVSGSVVPDEPGLAIRFEIRTREHVFRFVIADGAATVQMRPQATAENGGDADWRGSEPAQIDRPKPGRPMRVEFWHVDQSMGIYIDGTRVAHYEYDWSPRERLWYATGKTGEENLGALTRLPIDGPLISWHSSGSPVTLHRVRIDRDLYYLAPDIKGYSHKNPVQPEFAELLRVGSPGFGTHPDKPAVTGSDQFFMLGDNSPASSDSRLWGSPHPVVARQIDRSPFVVHRKLLLGKAWVVYFPAPYPLAEGGKGFIPDFGRLRFIR